MMRQDKVVVPFSSLVICFSNNVGLNSRELQAIYFTI